MQRLINSFISSNGQHVESPDVTPDLKGHNMQTNQSRKKATGLTGSSHERDEVGTEHGAVDMRNGPEVPRSEWAAKDAECYDGDIVVESIELDDILFRKKQLSKQDSKAPLCDLLRSGQTNEAPSFTKQVTKRKGRELAHSPVKHSASMV